MTLAEYRARFPAGGALRHLNNAGLAPISQDASDTICYWARRFHREGNHTNDDYFAAVAKTRESLARLIGAEARELAFFQNTSQAVSQLAFGFPLQRNDEVVLWDQEYASHLYPWKAACERADAKLVLVPSTTDLSTPVEKLVEAFTPKTKVVAVSWVQFQTGAVTDLAALSRETRARGIFLAVDGMQGLGLFPFRDWPHVDAFYGGSHKWLTSPVGVGFLALKLDHVKKLRELAVGAYTYGTCDDPTDLTCVPKKDASRFEPGSKQVLEITALGASVDLILSTGVEPLLAEAERLARILVDKLKAQGFTVHSPHGGGWKGSIVNFTPPPGVSLASVQDSLRRAGAVFAVRGPGLRLSPHAFNCERDLEGLF